MWTTLFQPQKTRQSFNGNAGARISGSGGRRFKYPRLAKVILFYEVEVFLPFK